MERLSQEHARLLSGEQEVAGAEACRGLLLAQELCSVVLMALMAPASAREHLLTEWGAVVEGTGPKGRGCCAPSSWALKAQSCFGDSQWPYSCPAASQGGDSDLGCSLIST